MRCAGRYVAAIFFDQLENKFARLGEGLKALRRGAGDTGFAMIKDIDQGADAIDFLAP